MNQSRRIWPTTPKTSITRPRPSKPNAPANKATIWLNGLWALASPGLFIAGVTTSGTAVIVTTFAAPTLLGVAVAVGRLRKSGGGDARSGAMVGAPVVAPTDGGTN